jgi:integrase
VSREIAKPGKGRGLMAILAECPICKRRQAVKNKVCVCGENLDKAKRSGRLRYWVQYRLPGGRQRKELVGTSIEEARDAEGKRRGQKREGRIFDMLPESKMTFKELAEWYLELSAVSKLRTLSRVQWCLDNFNAVFGDLLVSSIKPMDLEEYQARREGQGMASATIDLEVGYAKTMIRKAWDNDMVDGRTLKVFTRVKKRLRQGSNARDRIFTIPEYLALVEHAPAYLRNLIVTAYHTGMRRGELLKLRWPHVDREKGFIRLPAELTKENKPKAIPLNHHVRKALDSVPRGLHHDFVFTFKGQPIRLRFNKGFEKACTEAGITYGQKIEGGVRFHDLRTTFKTNMLRAGVDKVLRDTIVGHSLDGMDAYYLKPTDEDLRGAIERFTAWIDAQTASVTKSVTKGANSTPGVAS